MYKFLKYGEHKDMDELIMLLIKKKKKVIAFPFYENWFDLGTKDQLKILKIIQINEKFNNYTCPKKLKKN